MIPIDELPVCWPGDDIPDWDVVDEASWESFPASDPPSYSHPHPVRPGATPPHRPRPTVRARRARRRRRTP